MNVLYYEKMVCIYEILLLTGSALACAAVGYIFPGIIMMMAPVVFVLMLLILVLGTMGVSITDRRLTIRYGMVYRYNIDLKDITDVREDDRSIWAYGGSGIKFTRINGVRVRAYTTMGYPRVVVSIKAPAQREVVFSTRNPDTVVSILLRYAGR
ncbi:MAG: hypothetical protein DRH04_08370 [Deltaproteobacteria bacterium]|nr:MAG: hypothetical protein DRH04_08370 [Deltaproteobacteria bacterium]